MAETTIERLNAWFGSQIAACADRQNALLADDRADEAAFEKIRANVYDSFRTIFSLAVKTCKGDAAAIQQFFLLKIEQIPANWETAYSKAKQYADASSMQLEHVKLETAAEIKEKFSALWGCAQ